MGEYRVNSSHGQLGPRDIIPAMEAQLQVRVRLFAGYRERVGLSETEVDLPHGANVGRLASEMVSLFPDLVDDPLRLVVAVNEEYQDHLYILDEDDEVALIPPVSGGAVCVRGIHD